MALLEGGFDLNACEYIHQHLHTADFTLSPAQRGLPSSNGDLLDINHHHFYGPLNATFCNKLGQLDDKNPPFNHGFYLAMNFRERLYTFSLCAFAFSTI